MQDLFRGCLIGGAAGDALGYAVEFQPERMIRERFGPKGIERYRISGGLAHISDDTQMTLFTAQGLWECRDGEYAKCINAAYLDWLKTQMHTAALCDREEKFLLRLPALYNRRAPGNTCLCALEAGGMGAEENPINDSKGCGGVMRTAPVGLYMARNGETLETALKVGAAAAALTHGHPMGWLPGGMLAGIVYQVVLGEKDIPSAVKSVIGGMLKVWPETYGAASLCTLMLNALNLAENDRSDLANITRLGEGWVGEEALAIAVYCAARYQDDFDKALIAAVNHDGDSDSTGAICGNILGAKLGFSGLADYWTENLELKDEIIKAADMLHDGK